MLPVKIEDLDVTQSLLGSGREYVSLQLSRYRKARTVNEVDLLRGSAYRESA